MAPSTIHPAFAKAAHYFDVELKLVPVRAGAFVCEMCEYERAIDSDTILLLASAPSYPQVSQLRRKAAAKKRGREKTWSHKNMVA